MECEERATVEEVNEDSCAKIEHFESDSDDNGNKDDIALPLLLEKLKWEIYLLIL